MKNSSLVTGFRLTFVWIVIASITATVITYGLAAFIYIKSQYNSVYPANYYEKQIPGIDTYIRGKNIELLSNSKEEGLRNAISGDGIIYQVLDSSGKILYGTNKKRIFTAKKELINRINTTFMNQGNFIHVVPIIHDGNIVGAVTLSYQLRISYTKNNGFLMIAVIIIALFSPFFYVIGFTLLFSRMFVKTINVPLQLLMEASQKIKEKDLDFEIDYQSENELGRLCNAFSEMKEELKCSLFTQWKLEQERIEMIEALVHDLKTPLSIIKGYSEALMDSNNLDEKKLYMYLNIIIKNVEKSSNLVQQMQYTSDLENRDLQLQLKQVNLLDFLERKVRHYQLQAEERAINLVLKTHGDLGMLFLIDEDKLERILDNIISNSLEHTHINGRIEIFVKADNENVSYEICDSGKGFNLIDLDRAFDKFYRGDKSRKSKGGHSGLGLYIVKQLVEQLQGTIKIKNGSHGGACVIFTHPNYRIDNDLEKGS
ncbi:sensor histidine kinase [Peptostreptococcus canis]|uniref:histidine kinase n=1 Tax=Peptostreptococcus canis TaxID=1159213 RepID=A0ABR6TLU2_9FIRM|nr:HAMP domain-containing sensor histidine kinase [Peptostreptococcus canis]MBC2576280.1 HAMP domain-containing histidine kinase [Peptostreptococcus canis]MBP1998475.1 signal transduction histidine kinase [Peptostreptococcus canis]